MPLAARRSAIFLDRDGVLNRPNIRDGRPYPPASVDEFALLPGASEACAVLRAAGYALIVVTNQPDIARGTQSPEQVDAINDALRQSIDVDAIYVCPHDDGQGCDCRKPRPGLLLRAARQHNIDLPSSFMVGDRWRDIEAGRRAGCRTVFIDWGYCEPRAESPDRVVGDLLEAAVWIRELTRDRLEVHGG